jgi:hypothetical protein
LIGSQPLGREQSQSSGWGEPDTLEAQARVLGDQVVAAVLTQNTHAGLVRAGNDHDVDRREAVMAAGSQLSLATKARSSIAAATSTQRGETAD